MTNNILYFPYINVPYNEWTVRSILYWDNFAAIVPSHYVEKPNNLLLEMKELVTNNLVTQIFPNYYIREIENFDENFKKLILEPDFEINIRRSSFKEDNFQYLHTEKFGTEVMTMLVDNGLARKMDREYEETIKEYADWYKVETFTAKLFMSHLAKLIGETDNYIPATDNLDNIVCSVNESENIEIKKIRSKLLEDLMPYPIRPDIEKLANFKENNSELLQSFRNLLERKIIEIVNIQIDKKLQQRYYDLNLDDINCQKKSILEIMNASNLGDVVCGDICGIIGSLPNPFGMVSSIHSSINKKKKEEINPIAYLALIDKQLRNASR
jgi:hypothetical protein